MSPARHGARPARLGRCARPSGHPARLGRCARPSGHPARLGRCAPVAAALAAAALLAACGGSPSRDDAAPERSVPPHAVPPRPVAAGPRLVEPAPEWVEGFCEEVRRRSGLGCPRAVPSGFAAPALPQERPTRRGFTLAGSAGAEWRIAGSTGRSGPPLAAARVRSRGRGVVLRWKRYAIRVEGSADPRLRRQLRAVARRMGRG